MTRRRFLSVGAGLLGVLCSPDVSRALFTECIRQRATQFAMGGWNFIEITGNDSTALRDALGSARGALLKVQDTLSVFDARSELYQLNVSPLRKLAVDHPLMVTALTHGLNEATETNGFFDPTVEPLMRKLGHRPREGRPSDSSISLECIGFDKLLWDARTCHLLRESSEIMLDFGAWAKGYAAERAAEAAMANGADTVLAHCGGDIVCRSQGKVVDWTTAIRDPRGSSRDIAVAVHHAYPAVATSGQYENPGHLLNPRTGTVASSSLQSVTVFGPEGGSVDALSSAMFVAGPQGGERLLAGREGYAAIVLESGGRDGKLRLRSYGDFNYQHLANGIEMI